MNSQQDLATLLEAAKGFENTVGTAVRDKQETVSQIIQAIKNGQTTGDTIKDFVLRWYRDPTGDIEQFERIYQKIDREFREHPGDLVLVIINSTESLSRTGCFGRGGVMPPTPDPEVLRSKCFLGLTTADPRLGLNAQGEIYEVIIPTSEYLEWDMARDVNYVSHNDNITIGHWNRIGIETQSKITTNIANTWGVYHDRFALEIFIGTEAIEKFFEPIIKGTRSLTFRNQVFLASEKLGKPLTMPDIIRVDRVEEACQFIEQIGLLYGKILANLHRLKSGILSDDEIGKVVGIIDKDRKSLEKYLDPDKVQTLGIDPNLVVLARSVLGEEDQN